MNTTWMCAVGLAGLTITWGCRESLAAGPAACPGDSVRVAVKSGGQGPQFSWTPTCLMGMVQVNETDTVQYYSGGSYGGIIWRSNSTDTNTVLPPVTYGQRSAGTWQEVAPQALVPGTVYTVSVWRIHTESGRPYWLNVAGQVSFTP